MDSCYRLLRQQRHIYLYVFILEIVLEALLFLVVQARLVILISQEPFLGIFLRLCTTVYPDSGMIDFGGHRPKVKLATALH